MNRTIFQTKKQSTMAKQIGIIKTQGTLDDLTFSKTKDGYIVKKRTSLDGSKINNDPNFQRTRENNSEFGKAAKAGKMLRNAIRNQLQNAKDFRVVSRLTKEMMKVIKADSTNTRGQRNVIDGETEMLQGFDFNINAKLSTTLYAPFTSAIDRATGALTVDIPSFIPANSIAAPVGTTHFKIVSAAAEVDFENETFVTDNKSTATLPWDNTATAAIILANAVGAGSAHPLFLLLGIQFFQEVNGTFYPLKSGVFNALNLVKVSGV
jgi:hypothetical protein